MIMHSVNDFCSKDIEMSDIGGEIYRNNTVKLIIYGDQKLSITHVAFKYGKIIKWSDNDLYSYGNNSWTLDSENTRFIYKHYRWSTSSIEHTTKIISINFDNDGWAKFLKIMHIPVVLDNYGTLVPYNPQ